MKNSLKEIFRINELIVQADNFVRSIDKIVTSRIGIYLPDYNREANEDDPKNKISSVITYFANYSLRGDVLTIHVNPELAEKPPYYAELNLLKNEISYIDKLSVRVYAQEKDILSAFQNEFALYALIIATLSIIIALFPIIASLLRGGVTLFQ